LASKIESLDLTLQQEITEAKLNFESTLINNFTQVNSNKIYSYIKSITKSKSLPATIHFDSNVASTDTDKANLFNSYFYSVFSNSSSPSFVDILSESPHPLNSIEFTEEVYHALTTLDPDKALGIDTTHLEFYKPVLQLFENLFTIYSHYCLYSYGHIPTEWKIHKIIPLFKAGDPSSVKNYRPISFLSNTSKVLEHLVYNKIINYVSNIIGPSQFGFTEKSSTLQQMLVF